MAIKSSLNQTCSLLINTALRLQESLRQKRKQNTGEHDYMALTF